MQSANSQMLGNIISTPIDSQAGDSHYGSTQNQKAQAVKGLTFTRKYQAGIIQPMQSHDKTTDKMRQQYRQMLER